MHLRFHIFEFRNMDTYVQEKVIKLAFSSFQCKVSIQVKI